MRPAWDLKIEYTDIDKLQPFKRNSRTHSRKQIQQIAESIRVFGFTNPVLVDDDQTILAGHGRVAAGQLAGMKQVPCVRLSHMTAAQKRAYVLADNKLALNAGWDEEILAIELQGLQEIDLDFDLALTGFSTAEIDALVAMTFGEDQGNPAEELLPSIDESSFSKLGDLWLLGPHRILCGDSIRPESFSTIMGSEMAEMVFVDPPYNVPIDGHVSGLGKIKHREFAMAAGEMSRPQFVQFLLSAFRNLSAFSRDGSIHYICMDWRHLAEVIEAGEGAYNEFKNLCVWVKDNGGMGTFYRSRHEMVLVFKSGTGPHTNNFELGQHGRYRTNVWSYRGMNSRNVTRDNDLALHPTVKPVAMIADAIRDVSKRSGIVLDCFGGSGSVLIAAHKTARRARLIEFDPIYVDRSVRRWQDYAKDDAYLAATKQTFAEVALERREVSDGLVK